ncbi:MAG TPA: hypothetical protein VGK32_12955 [Vicinamibacterales bacterium]|jgi:hypothetical protein
MADTPPAADEVRALLARVRKRLEQARRQTEVRIVEPFEPDALVQFKDPIARVGRTASWLRRHDKDGWPSSATGELARIAPTLRQADDILSKWTAHGSQRIDIDYFGSKPGEAGEMERRSAPGVRIRLDDFKRLTKLLGDLPGDDPTDA